METTQPKTGRIGKVFIYKDNAGEWRWKYVKNGRIMATGAEGYATEFGVKRAINQLKLLFVFAGVESQSDSNS